MTRYQVRWSNGYWKTFDTFLYCGISLHQSKVDAEHAVADLNSRARSR